MDAPGDASRFFERHGMRSGAVVYPACWCGCQKPLARMEIRRYADRVHIAYASLKSLGTRLGLPDPVSLTVCPYSFSVLPTSIDGSRASPFQAAAAGTR